MNLFRSDRLFEEAARSADGCDKLLHRLKRARTFGFISFLALAFITLGFCVWALVLLMRVIHSPTLATPPSVDTILSFPPSLVASLAVAVLFGLALDFAMILHNDACIKMLLLIRGQQTLSAATK
jgi:hypothetical protein